MQWQPASLQSSAYWFGIAYGSPLVITNTSTFNINKPPPGKILCNRRRRSNSSSIWHQQFTRCSAANELLSNITTTSARVSWISLPACIKGFSPSGEFWPVPATGHRKLPASATQTNLTGLLPDTAYEWRIVSGRYRSSQEVVALSSYITDTFNTAAEQASLQLTTAAVKTKFQ